MIQQLNSQIERFSSLSFRAVSFPAPLEARFEADTCIRRCRRVASEGLLGILFFNLFLFADRLTSPALFHHALIVRLGILTPLSLALNFRLWRTPGMLFRESAMATITSLAALTHLFLEANISAVNSVFALLGVLIIVVYVNSGLRLRVPFAVATSLNILVGELVFLHTDHFLLPAQKFVGVTLTIVTIIVSLMANHSANREERLSHLRGLRGDLLLQDLQRSNQLLAQAAQTDALTGLTNRLGFDLRFPTLWRSALASSTPFSVLMVDVDHFKRINDTFGHPYGDRVLQRIARLILESLRLELDFAARFGGEEFVILLPDTTLDGARIVAERLRNLVHLAGLPPIDAGMLATAPLPLDGVTVSCGIATTSPQSFEERKHLLAAADKALYEAKAQGRNRVNLAAYQSTHRASDIPARRNVYRRPFTLTTR